MYVKKMTQIFYWVIKIYLYIQSNLYSEVTFWTKKKWPYKTGDLLKEVQFIWNFLWQDKRNVTF